MLNTTNRTSLKYALAAATAAVALLSGQAAQAQSDLQAEIKALRDRLGQLESQVGKEKRRVAAAAAVEAGDKPRSWKLPGTNTSMNIGGYVKFDLLLDFAGAAGDAIAISGQSAVGTAANNSSNGPNFRLHARQSRLWFQTWTPTDWGEFRTYIEADFFGPAFGGSQTGVLRLRHAFGTLGPVLAGQTWSTFMPVFAGAPTLDFGGPTGQLFVRQAQVRYTHNFGGGLQLEAALEDPTADNLIAGTNTTAGTAIGAQRFPDAVLAVTYTAAWGRLWAAGLVRQIEHDSGGPAAAGRLASSDEKIGWGAAAAATFKPFDRLDIGLQGVVGKGIGKYLNAAGGTNDAIVTTFNNLETVLQFGAVGWAQFKLTDTIAVMGAFGWQQQFLKDEVAKAIIPAGAQQQSWSAQGNITWNPIPAVTFGAEYSHFVGSRYNGPDAQVSRVQLSAQYRF